MARDLDGAIAERSRLLLGLLTIAHLDALGVTRQRRRTLVAGGVLVPVHRGVLRHAAHPTSRRQAVLAAVLAAGEGAVASHCAAAALYAFDGVDRPRSIDVLVVSGRSARSADGFVVHRTSDLGPADRDVRHRIPCTTPARTLLDIAPVVAPTQLEVALDDAERRGLVRRPHLRWRIDALRRRGRTGVPQVEALLDRTEGRELGDSWLEQQALREIALAGLPAPRCQVRLRKVGGGIARVDLFWDDARLAVELAGHGTHATRRNRQADAERAARLGLAGWQVVQFTYEDVVERPHHVVAMVRAFLAMAAAA
jgi:very-short-patch-repair endonuclease